MSDRNRRARSTEFRYTKQNKYFAQINEDCKEIGAQELEELGAKNLEPDYRGIYFTADDETLYKVIYQNRLFTRILAPLHRFDVHQEKALYYKTKEMEWDKIIPRDGTFAIFANVGNSDHVKHSQYAALLMKDAIVDYFRDKYGDRPDVDRKNPDVWINLFVNKNKATINLDLTGGAGFKRGYRTASVDAPLNENLGAAIVRHTRWEGERPFLDPMAGSGTIALEAAMKYCRIPAGYLRKKFGCFHMPNFNQELWDKQKSEADAQIRELPEGLIYVNDQDPEAIEAIQENAANLPGIVDNLIVRQGDFREMMDKKGFTIVSNPPYGMRLKTDGKIEDFVRTIGDFLKQKCSGSTAWLYFGERQLLRSVGLRTSRKIILFNSGLDGRLARFDMYDGTLDP